MSTTKEEDHFSEAETAKLRDEALRRALSMPPVSRKTIRKKPKEKKPAK